MKHKLKVGDIVELKELAPERFDTIAVRCVDGDLHYAIAAHYRGVFQYNQTAEIIQLDPSDKERDVYIRGRFGEKVWISSSLIKTGQQIDW